VANDGGEEAPGLLPQLPGRARSSSSLGLDATPPVLSGLAWPGSATGTTPPVVSAGQARPGSATSVSRVGPSERPPQRLSPIHHQLQTETMLFQQQKPLEPQQQQQHQAIFPENQPVCQGSAAIIPYGHPVSTRLAKHVQAPASATQQQQQQTYVRPASSAAYLPLQQQHRAVDTSLQGSPARFESPAPLYGEVCPALRLSLVPSAFCALPFLLMLYSGHTKSYTHNYALRDTRLHFCTPTNLQS